MSARKRERQGSGFPGSRAWLKFASRIMAAQTACPELHHYGALTWLDADQSIETACA
jgi:hypothetical protein